MQHLRGSPRIALGNSQRRIAVRIGKISIPPRDFRQPGAPAANDSRPLCYGEAIVERPIADLSCRDSVGSKRTEPLVFQRIRHDRFEDSARMDQRYVISALLQRVPAVGVCLFEDRP